MTGRPHAAAGALVGLALTAACYASHALEEDADGALDADTTAEAATDEAGDAAGDCGCPCTDPARACHGRPATTVTLREAPGGVTQHRPRRPCLELTYDPAVAFPDRYRAALQDWLRDCPDAFCLASVEPNPEFPRYACTSRIHFAPVGAVDETWGNCSGGEGVAGWWGDAATGAMHEACIEVGADPSPGTLLRALGMALGLDFVPSGVDSVMANPRSGEPAGLSELDREGFCAAYGGSGFCAE